MTYVLVLILFLKEIIIFYFILDQPINDAHTPFTNVLVRVTHDCKTRRF